MDAAEEAFRAAKAAGGLVSVRKRLYAAAREVHPGFTVAYHPEVFHDYLTARRPLFSPVLRLAQVEDFLPQYARLFGPAGPAGRAVLTWFARLAVCCQEHRAPPLPRGLPAECRKTLWAAASGAAFSIGEEDRTAFFSWFRGGQLGLPEHQTSAECYRSGYHWVYRSSDAQAMVDDLLSRAERFAGAGGKSLFISCGQLQRSWAVAVQAKAAVDGTPEDFSETLLKATHPKGPLTKAFLDALFPYARAAKATEAEAAQEIVRVGLSKSRKAALEMFKSYWRRYRDEHGLPSWDEWVFGAGSGKEK